MLTIDFFVDTFCEIEKIPFSFPIAKSFIHE